jgi:hypothetical protein
VCVILLVFFALRRSRYRCKEEEAWVQFLCVWRSPGLLIGCISASHLVGLVRSVSRQTKAYRFSSVLYFL